MFLINTVVVFFLINSFYIVPPLNSSTLLAPALCILGLLLKPKFISDTKRLIFHKKSLTFLFIMAAITSINIFITLLHGTFDLSYAKNFLSQFVQFLLTCLSLSYIFYNYTPYRSTHTQYVSKLIVGAFLLQSLIQVFAFISPEIASIVHLSYKDKALQRLYYGYNGVRGLALTGSPGWGLAVGYGLAFLLFFKEYIVAKKVNIYAVCMLLLLILGSFFAGRTAFVGLILSCVYFLISKQSASLKLKTPIKILVVSFLSGCALYLILPTFSNLLIDRVFPFVFEFVYSFNSTGTLQTRSTNILAGMWKIPIDIYVALVGTGWFTDPTTSGYYMGTDVGYLRNLLFGGFLWVSIVFFYNLALLLHFPNLKLLPLNQKLFLLFALLYSLILEAKAMTLGFNKYLFTIFLLYSLSLLYEQKPKTLLNREGELR